jgi:tetratricopeptide (TPR) repeat protein
MAGVYYSRYAHALGVTKDKATAIEMLDGFAKVTDPDETEKLVLFHRGRILEALDGDTEKAEEYYEKALSGHWDVGLVDCANQLARLRALRGERAEAIALWEKARAIAPDNVSVLWNLAIAYRDSGQPEKSAEMLEKVRVLTGNPDLGREQR